ncbi:hypothetical protein ACSQ76_08230 [Roseovarius sp. B08]|uniref:hypothetical protein n=1 Tax=Roseovarius sp. B08 TaxID=3449223 RepID=UPI003EDB78B9
MEINQHDYARACGCCVETAGRRLRSATYRSGSRGTRLYNLAEALPTVRPREVAKGAIPALLSAATPLKIPYMSAVLKPQRSPEA